MQIVTISFPMDVAELVASTLDRREIELSLFLQQPKLDEYPKAKASLKESRSRLVEARDNLNEAIQRVKQG